MSNPLTVRVVQRGVLTLPKWLRETYDLKTGDTLSLIDLGGVFVLSPRRSEVDALADRIASVPRVFDLQLTQQGETLERETLPEVQKQIQEAIQLCEELLSEADQRDSLVAGPAKSEIDAAASWLDAVAQDMAQAITVAEQDVPETEHREWFKVMAAAVKPLEGNDA